ncbi:M23 family metallopeptidase [Sphingomonas sp. OK281]|uniref:M23 family metallopeptidase n=1 Tax=Sphingomonas sp. OK281 TaxID=1881067 RepID=UPI0008E71BCF|nr:M23 family metallopeptidase [Sphingomonas sp. OK281]SFO39394.1 Murein DD-endopeptidase MepM and murein hydrolase activator NlpD, contain LysM domain [Sphingomonas sp. OK281]
MKPGGAALARAAALALLTATTATAQIVPPPTFVPPPPTARASTFRWTGTLSQGGLILGTAPAGTRTVTLNGKPITLSPDGRFIAGFDRDAGPQASLTATLADGRAVTQPLAIAPRAWRIERLDTLPKFPAPDPVFAQLRPPELAQIVAARARTTDAQGWRQSFVWPATGRISGLFGSQRVYKGEPGSYHSGTDVAIPTGTIVTAPADGVVILAADHPFTLEGNLLMLDHGMGLNSAFLHLPRIDVKPGDHVRQGQPIGASGMTGRATGPHLHWALRWNDAKLDPMLVAGAMR